MKLKKKLKENIQLNNLTKHILLPVFLITLVMYIYFIVFVYKPRGTFDFTIAFSITVIGLLLLSYIATFIFDMLKQIPSHVIFYASSTIVMLLVMFDSSKAEVSGLIAVASLILSIGIIGLIVYQVIQKSKHKWYVYVVEGILLIVSLALVYVLLFWTGQANAIVNNAFDTNNSSLVIEASESLYDIQAGVYGNEKYLEKHNDKPGFISDTTSISYFLNKWNKTREAFLGFNIYNVPLNGQYFIPETNEKSPLVLIVHGNHEMSHDSEVGYTYLGEYLASRGYIVVSVDENFLNYSSYDTGIMQSSLGNENDARAYVLLEHVAYLLEANEDSESILYNKIDKDNIALMGHSRGGEAVAVAALFDEINYLPSDYHKRFNHDFDIKSIVAIAPTDKQYKPGGRGTTLSDVNYLLLHGTHDMDVSYMAGLNQYDRINYDKDSELFKSSVSIYGASHGQFNETWSQVDASIFTGLLNNSKQLIERKTQEEVASQLIYYFLEATLKEKASYREGFTNLKSFVDLPDGLYQSQYHDGYTDVIVDYSEDNFLETGTTDVKIEVNNLSKWYEGQSRLDGKTSEVYGAYIGWRNSSNSSYNILFNEELKVTESDYLYLTVADDTKDNTDLLDFKLRLEDANGETSEVPLSYYGKLQHRIEINIPKLFMIEDYNKKESILQTFQLPIEQFVIGNPNLNINQIIKVSLVFDEGNDPIIFLKDLGIRREIKK